MIHLVFDYDGTLHDPVKVFAPAFRDSFGRYIAKRSGHATVWPDERIASWFGVSMDVFRADIAPFVEPERLGELTEQMSRNVKERIAAGEQTLFPGTEEVLRSLRDRGFRLILFSKCDRAHIERQRKALPLDDYFDAFFCTGDFGDMRADKAVIFPRIRSFFPGNYVIIGDRRQDIDIALQYGLFSIGCRYGYGSGDELAGATLIADDVSDIPRLLDELLLRSGW